MLSDEAFADVLLRIDEADFSSYIFQYPPLAVWERSPDEEFVRGSWDRVGRDGGVLGLYVHIPFCETKCDFCRFFVVESNREAEMDAYVDALGREARLWSRHFKSNEFATLYIGGGTPSLLSVPQLDRLFGALRRHFRLARGHQISFEANPDFLDREKLSFLRGAGVERLTIGVQSLEDAVVKRVNRTQDNRKVAFAYAAARDAGIPWINVDLMTGLPGQTVAGFRRTLDEVLRWRPDMIHVNPFLPTGFTRFAQKGGRLGRQDAERSRAMQRMAAAALAVCGYRVIAHDAMGLDPAARNRQLEDSVIHQRPFLGLGVGAVSCASGAVRHVNAPSLASYHRLLQEGRLPLFKACRLTTRDEYLNYAMNNLWYGRLSEREFFRRYGAAAWKRLANPLAALERKGAIRREEEGLWILDDRDISQSAVKRAFFDKDVVEAILSRKALPGRRDGAMSS